MAANKSSFEHQHTYGLRTNPPFFSSFSSLVSHLDQSYLRNH